MLVETHPPIVCPNIPPIHLHCIVRKRIICSSALSASNIQHPRPVIMNILSLSSSKTSANTINTAAVYWHKSLGKCLSPRMSVLLSLFEFKFWKSDSCLVWITLHKITYSAFYRFLDNVQRLTNVPNKFNTSNFPQFCIFRIKDQSFCSNKREFNINLNQSRIILTVLAALPPKIH